MTVSEATVRRSCCNYGVAVERLWDGAVLLRHHPPCLRYTGPKADPVRWVGPGPFGTRLLVRSA